MKFAIISPATEIMPEYLDGVALELCRRGHEVIEMPHARGPLSGTFASSDDARRNDLISALKDPNVDVILCGRGGYGCIHLLSEQLQQLVSDNPKWLIGFSDVSALHALWLKGGAPSIHASMAKQWSLVNPDFLANSSHPRKIRDEIKGLTEKDKDILEMCCRMTTMIIEADKGTEITYNLGEDERNIPGIASAEIVGGNLAVLNGLAATPWDIFDADYLKGKILFLEDVGEKIYQVERMLKRLQLSGALKNVAALIFGQFTDYNPDRNFNSMEAMISTRLKEWRIEVPTVFNAPIGHIHNNIPIREGGKATLTITPKSSFLTLKF